MTAVAGLLDHRRGAAGFLGHRGGRGAGAVRLVAGVAAAALLTACGSDDPAAACKVDVTTSELEQQRTAAEIPDCEPGDGEADLPDVPIPCLGSDTEVSLADVEGPAIINFWSTTCVPCIEEMPALAEFDRRYGDQVDLIGLNWQDTYPEAAVDLAARSGVGYASLADPCGALGETDLAVVGLPQFVFVRADGSVEMANGGLDSVAEVVELAEANLDVDLERAAS